MIRVALVSDTHADADRRFDEHERVMAFIADDIATRGVDLVLHGGDWMERAISSDRERAAVGAWVQRVCESAPLVGVAGNHDSPLDAEWIGHLRTRHALHVVSAAAGVAVAGCRVAAVPWPRKGHLLAALGRPVSPEEAGAVAQDALRQVLLGLGAELDQMPGGGPKLFVGHVDLSGAVKDDDQPMVNGDMSLSLADLSLVRADFYGLGHIHQGAGNEWEIDGAPCLYPGAPRHNNWGETATGKGYVIADFGWDEVDGAWRCVGWERIATPCRPMLKLEEAWAPLPDGTFGWTRWAAAAETAEALQVRGAEVRVRYEVDADQRDVARADVAKWMRTYLLEELGAYSVKVEEVVRATTRARAPEIAAAKTLPEQLDAFWSAKGIPVAPERKARVRRLLAEIEAEVAA